MNKNTKLNGPIRALFKAKAREKLGDVKNQKIARLSRELKQMIADLCAVPRIKGLRSELEVFLKRKHALEDKCKEIEMRIEEVTGANFYGLTFHGFKEPIRGEFQSLAKAWLELNAQYKRAEACVCHAGEPVPLLDFAAQLSLCKTVGEAEELLKNLQAP